MINVYASRVDVEFSIEWIRNNPHLYVKQHAKFLQDHAEGWNIKSDYRPGIIKLIAERITETKTDNSGWLRSGSLLYRLTDESRPENCDEINVTMADGSRESEPREKRALQLLGMLGQNAKLTEALRWALEWIDAVPDNVLLPTMPGFDRDYVNGLLEGVQETGD